MYSFVIANGTSRLGFNLNRIKESGVVWGCNALYREYTPHYELPNYLVAIDDGMIKEIERSDFPKDRFILPPIDERWEPVDCNPHRPRSNAGVNAMIEAIKKGSDVIIGLGFDSIIIDKDQSVSNVYDNTPNYGHENRANYTDNAGRVRYLNWVAKKNPMVEFYFCYPKVLTMHAITAKNINIVTYKNLIDNIHNDTEKTYGDLYD